MLPNKDLLVPGPWYVVGNKVIDANGRTVAVCFARHSTAHAYWLAAIPEFAKTIGKDGRVPDRDEEIGGLMAQILLLQEENEKLSNRVEDLENQLFAVE
jgi:uncharacterized protein YlxW (UPF0749 family)